MRDPIARCATAALFVLLGAGCTSYASYRFGPALQDVEVRTPDGTEVIARFLVSVRGIREHGDDEHELRFRARIENRRPASIELEGGELVDAKLTLFGPPRIEPPPGPIPPGGEALYEIAFPFPRDVDEDELDFSALNLRLSLREGEHRWTWSAGFERLYDYPYYYPDPYWDPWYGFGFGASVTFCD